MQDDSKARERQAIYQDGQRAGVELAIKKIVTVVGAKPHHADTLTLCVTELTKLSRYL